MIEKLIQALPQYKRGSIDYYKEDKNYFMFTPDGRGALFNPEIAAVFVAYGLVCFCMAKNDRVELIIY